MKPALVVGAGPTLSRCATYEDAQQDQIPWEIPPASEQTGAGQPCDAEGSGHQQRSTTGCIRCAT